MSNEIGPLRAWRHFRLWNVVNERDIVANLSGPTERQKRLAHLFAAAPDLLKACEAALHLLEQCECAPSVETEVVEPLRAAIAKAEGE